MNIDLSNISSKELKQLAAKRESEELKQEFDSQILMFSESKGLMCSICDNDHYFVNNGCWYGKREGDNFTILSSRDGLTNPSSDRVLKITDWKEIRMGDLTKEEREGWYLPVNPPTPSPDVWDDDIAF